MHKLRIILLFLLLVPLSLPTQLALADTGPKPTMEFTFQQNLPTGQVTIISGTLVECDQPDCSDAAPLKQLGPQGLHCDATSCSALAYGFSTYHRLELQFSDAKMRQSNIFKTAGFDSKYTVTIRPDDLVVQAQFNPAGFLPWTWTVLCLVCACGILLLVVVIGLIVFFVRRSRKS